MAYLHLSFLGTFQATLDGEHITNFRSARIKGLLIFLALTAGQAHAREELASLLWPDEPDSVARKNLRQSLYRPSFGCDSNAFDDWLRQERDRLHRPALDALFNLAVQRLAQAAYGEAQSLARRQLALEPWREEAHRQLMQALILQGYRSAALSQYDLCRTILRDELGVEPSAQTKALAETIARHQPTTTTPNPPAAGPEEPRLIIPFVGRRTEFAQLVDMYQRSADRGVQIVMLVGNAGIGKTRLAQEFLLWVAAQGRDVLQGRAYETSTDLSYQPIIQLFRRRLEHENAPDDLLSDLWLAQFTRLWPELRERYPDLPEPIQENAVARQHLYEAVARLGQALATRAPLVLFIDDGQWVDTASLDVLRHAIVRWTEEEAPILLLLTLRQEALADSTETQRWLAQLRDHPASQQLVLRRFSEQETGQLVDRVLAAESRHDATLLADHGQSSLDRLRDWLFAETNGQPLFLTEMLKALVDEGTVARAGSDAAGWTVDWNKLHEHTTAPTVWPIIHDYYRKAA